MHVFLTFLLLLLAGVTGAETAHPGGFPTPVSETATRITETYNIIFWIISAVFVVVMVPITVALFRFRRSQKKEAATFSHNTVIEVVWTAIPALICVYIAYISFNATAFVRTIPEAGLTVEVVGYQFGWDFYYPDFSEGDVYLASPMPADPHPTLSLPDAPRYVPQLVVPVGVPIKVHVTGQDVIHSFYAGNLGIKIDTIPGRINYGWFTVDTPGEYIGQCTELCGAAHGEMFFTVKGVSMEAFTQFINNQRTLNGLEALPPADFTNAISAAPEIKT